MPGKHMLLRIGGGKEEPAMRVGPIDIAPDGYTPAEFAAFIAGDRARYKRIIDSAGIRIE